jgi:hypothetical protein
LTVNLTYNGSSSAPTNAGSYSVIGTINDSYYQGSATNTLVISGVAVTVASGITANNKVYDSTTPATLTSNSVVLAGVLSGDTANVRLSTNGYSANFATASVGTGIGVTVSGLTLTGSASANYTLAQPAGLTANITAAGVTIASGITANDRVYDTTTTATLASNSVVLAGVLSGDTASVKLSTNGYAATFASPNVANGLAVTVSGLTLTGAKAGNYSLTQPVLNADIESAFEAAVLAKSPYLFYEFNETSGTTAYDSSGNGYNGTYTNSPVMGGAGDNPSGGGAMAVTFNGTNQYLTTPSTLSFGSSLGTSTCEFVFKSTTTNLANLMGGENTGSGDNYQFGLNSSATGSLLANSFRFMVRDDAGSNIRWAFVNANLLNGQYHHVVLTFSSTAGTTGNTLLGATAYVDGAAQTLTDAVSGSPTTFNAFAQPIAFAADDNRGAPLNYAACTIAGVALYTTVLSAAQVTSNYNALIGIATASTLASSLNSSIYGNSVSFTNTVSPAPPNGETVTFFTNGTSIGTANLAGGVAVLTVTNLPYSATPFVVTANYPGDGNFGVSTGTLAGGQTVQKATLTYAANSASQAYGSANTNFSGSVSGFVNGDTLAGAATGSALFTSATTASSAPGVYAITGSGLVAANYVFTQAPGNANALTLTTAQVTISSGITVNSKIYDTTTTATLTSNSVVLAGVLSGDTSNVKLSTNGYTANFASASAGTGIGVTVSGLTLTGSAAANYTLTQPAGLTANITAAGVTISSGIAANNKVYDTTTIATLTSNSVVLAGVLSGDTSNVKLSTNGYTANFASASAGTGIGVTVSGLTLTGSAAANYTLTQPAGLTANITAAGVTISSGIAANNKVYDTTTTATLTSNSVVLAGMLSGDTANVKLSTNGYTANFASASAGTGIGVTVSGLTLTGSASANYTLTQPAGLTANITAAGVTITSGIAANNKVYDTTTTARLTSNSVVLAGVLSGDTANVKLSTNGYTANFASASAGTGIGVTVSGLTLTGSASANYTLTQPAGLTANITAALVTISSGIAANNKVYDTTTTATLTSNSVVLAGVLSGDTANVKLSTNGYTANFASAVAGTGIGVTVSGLTLTGSASANYTLTQPAGLTANITAAGVTITSGIAANNKVYDTSTTATLISNSVVLAGVLSGDTANVKLSTNGYTANFASASAGTGIGVTVSGLTLTGSASANYTLTQPAGLTANITAAGVTISSGIAANNKVYDTSTTATLTSNSVVLAGVLSGDTANVKLSTNGYTANFASASAGTGIGVTVSGLTLTGSASANYTLTQPAGLTANITAASVTIISGITANNKVYDSTTAATITSNNVVLAGVLSGDTANVKLSTNGYTATFASANVGTGIGVTVSALTLTGSAAANYTLTQPAGLTANITAEGVTIASGLTANNKVYDTTTTATLTSNSVVLAGVLSGDTANVKLSTNGYTANFASASAGTGIGVTVSGLTLTGSAAANYTLTQPAGLTANITAAGVTITSGIAANNKVYDTTTTATLTSNSVVLTGVLSGDTANVKLSTNGYTANFASASAGTGIAVTVSGLTLTGSAAANYTLTQPAGLTANITAAGVTISSGIAANNKVYDTTTTATLTSNSVVLAGVLSGDTANVKLSTNGYTANFASASAGTGIGVTVSGLTLTGSAAANYTLTQPAGLTANITAAGTLNAIISSLNPALPGASITFTATISVASPGSGTPSGNVIFKDGTTALSTNALNGAAVATFSTTTLSQGSHTIVAEYAGSGNFLGSTNHVSPNQIINTPPVAGNVTVCRNPLSGTKILVAALLTNASSPSGDTLMLTVSPTSASNAAVTMSGGWIFYAPLAGFTNADSFTFTVTDNYGGSATATVTVAIQVDNGQSQNLVITALGNNQFLISGSGIPGYTYRLQCSDTSGPFAWQDLVSKTADSTGKFQYTDTTASETRYYRTTYP